VLSILTGSVKFLTVDNARPAFTFAVKSAQFSPYFLADILDCDWLLSLQHILQVGCVMGQTSYACKIRTVTCRETVVGCGGTEVGLWIDRLRESWVKHLDGWVQQQIGDSAWCVGDGHSRLQGVVA